VTISETESFGDRPVTLTVLVATANLLNVVIRESNIPTVLPLLSNRCPATIPRLVMAIGIDPINCFSVGALAHV